MKLHIMSLFFSFIVLSSTAIADENKQKELDATCAAAREMKLTPLRQKYVEECIEKQKKDRANCETLYSDYGDQAGKRAPLFYDLPECVKAFDYQESYRQAK